MNKKAYPTVIVILGATGDLMTRKIVPALFHLFLKKKLYPLTRIIGFSRRQISENEFKKMVAESASLHLDTSGDIQMIPKFIERFSYQRGNFEDLNEYRELAKKLGRIDGEWKTCANKLFYLAVPPEFYEEIFNQLSETGLTKPCSPEEGWTRILVEKPFGKDAETAQKLDFLLGKLFKEVQIYRIDHYLAKEMLQNILTFRFVNNLFEKNWDNKSIEKVEIRLHEKLGVENRGKFYDGIGALRDVGQNHLLQMLALITMERPDEFNSEAILKKRAETLTSLHSLTTNEIKDNTYRAQYKNYRQIKDVNPQSTTETYFKIKIYLENDRWRGIPFILESGKRMDKVQKEIVITFKNKEPFRNKVVFTLEPEEGIIISFFSKKPGLDYSVEKRQFDFLFRKKNKKQQYIEEYQKLLLDAILGDQTLFVSTKEVKEMWRVIDLIINAWKKNKVALKEYQPDTEEPSRDSNFINRLTDKYQYKKEIGMIGLGKMGGNLSRQLMQKKWRVVGLNRSEEITKELEKTGLIGSYSMKEFIGKLSHPRMIWLMLPAGEVINNIFLDLIKYLDKGDFIIDGSNSYFKDTIKRHDVAEKKGFYYLDVGVSGGPSGALTGAALMVGGEQKIFQDLKQLFLDLAVQDGVEYVGKKGAGHFVKMVHNGIEYGMMQAIAEGFNVLKSSKYNLNLEKVADIYNHGSVIESRLIKWLKQALEKHGEDLGNVTSTVQQTGEGLWTLKTAKEMKIETKVIEDSVKFRKQSAKKPSYTGKVLSALREQFGGHKA